MSHLKIKGAASPSIIISLTYKTSHLALRALGHNKRAVFIVKRERENNLPDLTDEVLQHAHRSFAERKREREREIRF